MSWCAPKWCHIHCSLSYTLSIEQEDFEHGEDDLVYISSHHAYTVEIRNDVVFIPDESIIKTRLAVSFAIAQSSFLSIFEARAQKKIEDYRNIPRGLAKFGKTKIKIAELGNMIGKVFVLSHDVNLHSEILNKPDYFWKEKEVEPIYRNTMSYLQMENRIEILNKRIDLMLDLLQVIQLQQENSHYTKLEWIVIVLIVASVLVDLIDLVV